MTKKEYYDRFIPKEKEISYLVSLYGEELAKILQLWVDDINSDVYIMCAVQRFLERITDYWSDMDCLTAIVDCMRENVMEDLENGYISFGKCCMFLRRWSERRTEIADISVKQMNLILSDCTRKTFDYYINRYYYMKSISVDPVQERCLEKIFSGRGRITRLFGAHGFCAAQHTTEAYIAYARKIDPYFLRQIGGITEIDAHSDSLEFGLIRWLSNSSRIAFPIVFFMLIVIVVLAFLSRLGLIPW